MALLRDLLEYPGVQERALLRSRVGFLAVHGGLEAGTAEIAAAAAAAADASLYTVVLPDGLHWHVPSLAFDPAWSPELAAFLAHVDRAISVHGYGGLRTSDERWITVLVGGANRDMAGALSRELRGALPNYVFLDDLDAMPSTLRGVHPDNPVNRPRERGVQLELPPRIRRDPDVSVLIETLARYASAAEQREQVRDIVVAPEDDPLG
jgi:phage replication-related protein YjqB (UPF0714/DUF867 family)